MTNETNTHETTTLSINFPADTVFHIKAGGLVTDVTIEELKGYDNAGLARLFTYGFGRDVQDFANREIKAYKDAGEGYSARKIVDSRIAALISGDVTSRSLAKPVDPLEAFLAEVAREWFKANPDHKIAKRYDGIESKDQKARKAFAAAFAAQVESLKAVAETRHAEAKAMAEMEVDDIDFDFDADGDSVES